MNRLVPKRVPDERRLLVPLLILSMSIAGAYLLLVPLRIEELGRSAIFDVVMTFVVLGVTAFAGILGCLVHARQRAEEGGGEGYCFIGAVVGAIVFFYAMLL